ncbi:MULTISPECIES: hypothetical protein [Sorangium]|uniref:Uncharacterized protein n=1 Tax=Sorangium cellulosum TaxID=56 RepID=A0A4P2QKH5_SORCE|nr:MULTISPECIES: hypothetical protein [Sorangium]AUX30450.1 hypothetical protein SOCE836_025540 [Sorangium cellulosum]WCQ89845.1 hypothetical protein NQZ70_02538 [Sorangium sp. Soce836]
MAERSLQHRDPDSKDDETLRREARVHLASEPALQLVAELIARLRELDLPWWTPVKLRERFGAVERMGWFRERSDVRQQITTSLTGLSPRAARRKTPDFQGALIDSVIDEGDITPRAFEAAFDPRDLAVYGPAGGYWQFFRESMPWDQDTPQHQEIVAWLLKALLADRSPFEGIGRTPILTPWDVRTAIDGRLWQTRIPLEVRVAIDNARLKQERERPGVPFHADGELAIAGPDVIAANIPPREILPVVQLAQKAMRFDAARAATPKADAPKAAPAELSSGRSAAPAPPGGAPAPAAGAPASTPAASAPVSPGGAPASKPTASAPVSPAGVPGSAPAASAPASSGNAPASSPAAPASVSPGGAPDPGQAGKPAAGAAPGGASSGAASSPPAVLPPSVSSPPAGAPAGSRPAGGITPTPPSAIVTRPPSAGGAAAASVSSQVAEPPRSRLPSDPGVSSARASTPPAPPALRPSTPPAPRASTPPAPPAPRASTPPAPGASPAGVESLDDLEAEDADEGDGAAVDSERTNPWAVSSDEKAKAEVDDLDDLGEVEPAR